ncbi:NUMOD4 motif-containing HNH endonuclease [Mesorhizobium sp. M0139]|uniref:NUMOD4 motif-containing HNH endonuclease n=1 Tax=Mesorhizobium sp. M0139 TaxID=2956892 RepID=UPI0033374FD5
MSENWRTIPGFEGLYEVSDLGRVRSLDHVVLRNSPYHGGLIPTRRKGRVLKPCVTDGYEFVNIYRDGEMHRFAVHILVAAEFIGPRPEGLVVRHLDGVKRHNLPGNFCYGTPKENSEDSVKHGTLSHSEGHHKAKLTREDVAKIRAARGAERQIDLAERFGVCQTVVSSIQLGKIWRHV